MEKGIKQKSVSSQMIEKVYGNTKIENPDEMYLLDTNVFLNGLKGNVGLDNRNDYKRSNKTKKKINDSGKLIVKNIFNGRLKNIGTTVSVLEELETVLENKFKDGGAYDEFVDKIEKSESAFFRLNPDYSKESSEMINYLKRNVAKSDSETKNNGDLSLFVASIQTGIPTIITDDNMMRVPKVANYVSNIMKKKFGSYGRKRFEVLRSDDLCYLMKLD